MKRKVTIFLITIMLCSASAAFGFVMGDSNFDLMEYPEFSRRHYRPTKPYSRDTYSMQRYEQEVRDYAERAKKYINAANNDMMRIEEAIHEARKEANSVVDEYNSFVRTGY